MNYALSNELVCNLRLYFLNLSSMRTIEKAIPIQRIWTNFQWISAESLRIRLRLLFTLTKTYLSTIMPALIAWATLRNFGLSSPRLLMLLMERVKVRASQSRTSLGTASGSTSLSSSSSSHRRLQNKIQFIDWLSRNSIDFSVHTRYALRVFSSYCKRHLFLIMKTNEFF